MPPGIPDDEFHALQNEIFARGSLGGALPDDLLQHLENDLGQVVSTLCDHLEVDDRVLDDLAVLAGLDHAISAIAHLQPMLDRRRAAVESDEVSWDGHLDDIDTWRREQAARWELRRKEKGA